MYTEQEKYTRYQRRVVGMTRFERYEHLCRIYERASRAMWRDYHAKGSDPNYRTIFRWMQAWDSAVFRAMNAVAHVEDAARIVSHGVREAEKGAA